MTVMRDEATTVVGVGAGALVIVMALVEIEDHSEDRHEVVVENLRAVERHNKKRMLGLVFPSRAATVRWCYNNWKGNERLLRISFLRIDLSFLELGGKEDMHLRLMEERGKKMILWVGSLHRRVPN